MNPVLFIVMPLTAAFLSIIIKKADKLFLSIAALANVVLAAVTMISYTTPKIFAIGGFQPPFGISLVMDAYSLVGVILLNVIFAMIIMLSYKHITKYAIALSVALAALNGAILTGDLFNLFVFLEIAAISAYVITSSNKNLKYTFQYLVLGTLGSGLFLFGVVLLYNFFGTLNIADIQNHIANSTVSMSHALVLPMVMIFVGLSVEAKLIPFGSWVRGVLKDANPLVGTMIVSSYALAVLMVLGRLLNTVFVLTEGLMTAFTVIAVATLILAEAAAFSKKHMREILLFSSIAQSGLVVVLFLYGFTLPAMMVLVNNVVSKLVLFTIAGKLANDLGSDDIHEIRGVFSKYPLLGFGFTVSAMSLIGLPFFFGFAAKANALLALFNDGNIWLPIIVLLLSVVEGAYFVRMLTNLWNTGGEGELSSKEKLQNFELQGCAKTGITAALIGVVIIIFGILALSQLDAPTATDFLSFIKQCIGGM